MVARRNSQVESVLVALCVAALLMICGASPSLAQGPGPVHVSSQSKQVGSSEDPIDHVEPLSARLEFPLPIYKPELDLLPEPSDVKLRSWQTSASHSAWDALAQRMAMRVLLTWDAVEHNLAFMHLYGKDVVQVDVPGTNEVVHVGPDMAWYNLLGKLPPRYQVDERYHMGPYIQNWKSVGPGFEGHYGVKLKVAW